TRVPGGRLGRGDGQNSAWNVGPITGENPVFSSLRPFLVGQGTPWSAVVARRRLRRRAPWSRRVRAVLSYPQLHNPTIPTCAKQRSNSQILVAVVVVVAVGLVGVRHCGTV